jgi:hypothetical protein
LFKRFLLALLLLAAQHAAAMHALGHSMERSNDGQPTQMLHAGCLGLHGIDDVPVLHFTPVRIAPEFSVPCPEARPDGYASPHQSRYRSRAPPANS